MNATSLSTFNSVIESNLTELEDLRSKIHGDPAFEAQELADYLEVMMAYLQHDLKTLERFVLSSEAAPNRSRPFCLATQLRFEMRKLSVTSETLSAVLQAAPQAEEWEGELRFIAALALHLKGDHPGSAQQALLAASALKKIGAERKALMARQNYIIAQSCVDPTRHLFSDYHRLYREARRLGEASVAAMSLLNISREYQILQAPLAALRYCNRALAYLKNDVGSRNYFFTLAHRSHLLLELGRRSEARADYEMALIADFPEVQAALKVLESQMNLPNVSEEECRRASEKMPLTWRERMVISAKNAKTTPSPLGGLEQKLLRFLSEGPKSKPEMIQFLYGDQLDYLTAENRLKNVLSRLRKKNPGLILFSADVYRLADQEFLTNESALA